MSQHLAPVAALAEQHRRDLIAGAEAHRIARAARGDRPAPARLMRVIPQLIAAARRLAARLLPVKAAAGAGGE
jgi:hypothetical protein